MLKWVCVHEVSFLRLEWSILIPESCLSIVNKLMKRGFWKQAADAFRGWLLQEWQRSDRKGRQLLPGHHRAQAAWGCPLSRSVCLFCRLGTVLWPFCLQERGQQPLSSSCCENIVGKPERSFHSRTHPGKNPPEQTNLPNERPSAFKTQTTGLEPRWQEKRNENRCVLANFPSGISIY